MSTVPDRTGRGARPAPARHRSQRPGRLERDRSRRRHRRGGPGGIGEADAPAEAVRELVLMDDVHTLSRGLAGMLAGRDPFELGALHDELYGGRSTTGAGGSGSTRSRPSTSPSTTLPPASSGGRCTSCSAAPAAPRSRRTRRSTSARSADRSLAEVVAALAALAQQALALGFRAVKIEPLYERPRFRPRARRVDSGASRGGRPGRHDGGRLRLPVARLARCALGVEPGRGLRRLLRGGAAPARRPGGPREAGGARRDADRRRRVRGDPARVP